MAKRKPYILPLVIALIVLGGIPWTIGWLAHAAVDRAKAPSAALPATTAPAVSTATPLAIVQPQVEPATTPAAVISTVEPAENLNPTSTLQPTSALLPGLIPTPYRVRVQQGQGVLAICRDHCPSYNTTYDDMLKCVRRVAEINQLSGSKDNPNVNLGQELQMPPECFSQ